MRLKLFFTISLVLSAATVRAETKVQDISGNYQAQHVDASISIWQVSAGKIKIAGEAYWKGTMPGAINVGTLEHIKIAYDANKLGAQYTDEAGCKLSLKFIPEKKQLEVKQADAVSCSGFNVTFNDTYARKGPPKAPPQ